MNNTQDNKDIYKLPILRTKFQSFHFTQVTLVLLIPIIDTVEKEFVEKKTCVSDNLESQSVVIKTNTFQNGVIVLKSLLQIKNVTNFKKISSLFHKSTKKISKVKLQAEINQLNVYEHCFIFLNGTFNFS